MPRVERAIRSYVETVLGVSSELARPVQTRLVHRAEACAGFGKWSPNAFDVLASVSPSSRALHCYDILVDHDGLYVLVPGGTSLGWRAGGTRLPPD